MASPPMRWPRTRRNRNPRTIAADFCQSAENGFCGSRQDDASMSRSYRGLIAPIRIPPPSQAKLERQRPLRRGASFEGLDGPDTRATIARAANQSSKSQLEAFCPRAIGAVWSKPCNDSAFGAGRWSTAKRCSTMADVQKALEAAGVDFVGLPNSGPGIRYWRR